MTKKIITATVVIVIAMFLLGNGESYKFHYAIGHKVVPGETLWSIAEQYYSLQDKRDIREFIFDIREYNGMQKSPTIRVGQIVDIPIYKRR